MDGFRTDADRHVIVALIALGVVILLLAGIAAFWHDGTRRSVEQPNPDWGQVTTPSVYVSPSTQYRAPSYTYQPPSYTHTVPTTSGVNPMAQVAPGGNEYAAPDGSFSVVFPAPHTYANPTTLQVAGARVSATEVAVANGGRPWGFWATWSEPIMTTESASQILATQCTAQDPGESVLARAPIAIGGEIGVSCRIGGPWIDNYAYVYAHNRLFVLSTSEQNSVSTYAEFQTFVRSFKLGSR
jgi:hypothetical protein